MFKKKKIFFNFDLISRFPINEILLVYTTMLTGNV